MTFNVTDRKPGAGALLSGDWQYLYWFLAALLVALCLTRAIQMAWLADDAFISFRYAEQLVAGNGLVYNAGERVEGYTNLSWTLAIAVAIAAGFDPEQAAHWLGIGAWLSLVIVLALYSRAQSRYLHQWRFPLAACLVLAVPDYQLFATGGLETSLFALFSVTGLLLLALPATNALTLLCAGAALAFATLTRPDGALFAAFGIAVAMLPGNGYGVSANNCKYGWQRGMWVGGPLLATAIPLVWFKLSYYGDLFPTAFYAKSALDPYYTQGLIYLKLFFQRNWFALPALLVAGLLARLVRENQPTISNHPLIVFMPAFCLFGAYVAHSGGDFMYARRLIPCTIFLFLAIDDLAARIAKPALRTGLVVIILIAAALPQTIFQHPTERISGIALEHGFYTDQVLTIRRQQGETVRRLLGDTPLRAMFAGGMCVFGYHSGLPYLAEMTGLTQYSLAKQPLPERGAIGHEKTADDAWLDANHIHLVFLRDTPPLEVNGRRVPTLMRIGDRLTAYIRIYDDRVMDALRDQPEVDFVPIEVLINDVESKLPRLSAEAAKSHLEFLDRYYFNHAPAARQKLAERLRLLSASSDQ